MTAIPVRVTVLDTWEEFPVEVPTSALVSELKSWALEQAKIRRDADGYEVKFRGARLDEGARTVGDSGIVPNAALIVLARRRIPAR